MCEIAVGSKAKVREALAFKFIQTSVLLQLIKNYNLNFIYIIYNRNQFFDVITQEENANIFAKERNTAVRERRIPEVWWKEL